MPLLDSGTKEAFKKNVAEMVKAGHPLDQALAAAYKTARENGAEWAEKDEKKG
jgi:hypothetical protein